MRIYSLRGCYFERKIYDEQGDVINDIEIEIKNHKTQEIKNKSK